MIARRQRASADRRTASLPLVAIYADESCLGNGREGSNPGGAAGVIEYVNPRSGQSDALGLLDLRARDDEQSHGAAQRDRRVSRHLAKGCALSRDLHERLAVSREGDERVGVRLDVARVEEKDGPILNLELWQEAVEAVRGHQVSWQWVRGHEGHPQNEYANDLAVRAAHEQTSSGGVVASHFDEWLATQRTKKRVSIEPQAFPTAERFKAGRSYPAVRPPVMEP